MNDIIDNNNNNGCLLIICPGCQNVLSKCKYIFHCENECPCKEMFCINKSIGCLEVINRYLMKHHLASSCKYRITDNCSCEQIKSEDRTETGEAHINMDCIGHCENCIAINCVRTGCPISACVCGCGARLHSCKMTDHLEFICPTNVVACINHAYGCGRRVQRSEMASHVQWCAASVVACGREWTRRVQGCKLYQVSLDGSHTDSRRWCEAVRAQFTSRSNHLWDRHFLRALSLRDLLYLCTSLNGDLNCYGSKDRNDGCLWPLFSRRNINSVRSFNNGECQSLDDHQQTSLLGRSTNGINKQRETSLQQTLIMDCPLSLWGSSQDSQIISDQLDQYPEWIENEARCWADEISASTNDGDWRVQHLTWDQEKPVGSYTFQCGQAVPRQEWEGHWRQHCDLSAQMDGWVESACPLAHRGCTFSVARLAKATSSTLVYHPLLDTYCQRFSTPPHTSPTAAPDGFSMLLHLPFEVLVRVCSFLDGCSLFHVSRCHPRLTEAVRMLLGKCCVSLEWHRSQTGNWVSRVVWFRPISLGSLEIVQGHTFTSDAVGAISEHLKSCSFKGPLSSDVDTTPYCLHRVSNGDAVAGLPEFLRSTCR